MSKKSPVFRLLKGGIFMHTKNVCTANAVQTLVLFGIVYTKNQLKTVQKIEHNLAYMDYAKIFCLQFYWLLVLVLFAHINACS